MVKWINFFIVTLCIGTLFHCIVSPVHASYTESTYYIHTDNLGSVIAVSDENGNNVEYSKYAPYGKEALSVKRQAESITEREYTGQIADKNTQLAYYNARYYDPVLSRFISADSVNDQLNRYSYVGGNPIMRNDPGGDREEEGWGRIDNDTESIEDYQLGWTKGIHEGIFIKGGINLSYKENDITITATTVNMPQKMKAIMESYIRGLPEGLRNYSKYTQSIFAYDNADMERMMGLGIAAFAYSKVPVIGINADVFSYKPSLQQNTFAHEYAHNTQQMVMTGYFGAKGIKTAEDYHRYRGEVMSILSTVKKMYADKFSEVLVPSWSAENKKYGGDLSVRLAPKFQTSMPSDAYAFSAPDYSEFEAEGRAAYDSSFGFLSYTGYKFPFWEDAWKPLNNFYDYLYEEMTPSNHSSRVNRR